MYLKILLFRVKQRRKKEAMLRIYGTSYYRIVFVSIDQYKNIKDLAVNCF